MVHTLATAGHVYGQYRQRRFNAPVGSIERVIKQEAMSVEILSTDAQFYQKIPFEKACNR